MGDRIVLGTDAARQGYLRSYGGSPGLAYLLGALRPALTARGLPESVLRRFFVDNPARVFAFATPADAPATAAPATAARG